MRFVSVYIIPYKDLVSKGFMVCNRGLVEGYLRTNLNRKFFRLLENMLKMFDKYLTIWYKNIGAV